MSDLTKIMLSADETGFARAADLWKSGGLVAFPTETVYGLGADARKDLAVAKIFEAKERPSFNPLIVHVASIAAAQDLVHWNDAADRLAQAFWPGPLTLVLPLKDSAGISPLVTAGKDTLAVRMPAHPVAQALLAAFQGPIAAPSANPSGRISPTEATHVAEGLGTRVNGIMDGGACDVGVESTIVGLFDAPTLLRPGGLPLEAIEAAIGTPLKTLSGQIANDDLTAPGQLASHYAPGAQVRLNATQAHDGEVMLGFGDIAGDLTLSASGDLREAAANLFHHLHRLDKMGAQGIAVAPVPNHGLGLAINDRLSRAAAPREL
ncbi:L-threonylcarbamoyladenylate synthase [Cognatishimia activa]|uniref:Threonylcarbamoyl-AMP synthase n=1 Tax=Cognatishimia activa TaxID=1715691 RepID=A0A975ER38_9RHOB|nr:L-threonylcarbamoyladenylate synthase [Cognatishimia activa]QTN36674.1 threonylcarbamoyl-AMP synthase [Cognatishimia activa]